MADRACQTSLGPLCLVSWDFVQRDLQNSARSKILPHTTSLRMSKCSFQFYPNDIWLCTTNWYLLLLHFFKHNVISLEQSSIWAPTSGSRHRALPLLITAARNWSDQWRNGMDSEAFSSHPIVSDCIQLYQTLLSTAPLYPSIEPCCIHQLRQQDSRGILCTHRPLNPAIQDIWFNWLFVFLIEQCHPIFSIIKLYFSSNICCHGILKACNRDISIETAQAIASKWMTGGYLETGTENIFS